MQVVITLNTDNTEDVQIMEKLFGHTVSSDTEEKPGKKRGRPKGSKNKKPAPEPEPEPEPEPTPQVTPQEAVTLEDLRNKARTFLKEHGAAPMQALLQKFDVAKVSDLEENKWVEFLGAMIDYNG